MLLYENLYETLLIPKIEKSKNRMGWGGECGTPVLVRSLKLSTLVHNQFGITIFLFSPCGIFIIIMDALVQLHV